VHSRAELSEGRDAGQEENNKAETPHAFAPLLARVQQSRLKAPGFRREKSKALLIVDCRLKNQRLPICKTKGVELETQRLKPNA
jgi:hypothetical protein